MGVEYDIRLSEKEITDLETNVLRGILRANEQDGSKKSIDLFLIYSHQDRDEMQIIGFPKGYLGNADHLWITLFNYDYDKLTKTGYCGDRINNSIRIFIQKS